MTIKEVWNYLAENPKDADKIRLILASDSFIVKRFAELFHMHPLDIIEDLSKQLGDFDKMRLKQLIEYKIYENIQIKLNT